MLLFFVPEMTVDASYFFTQLIKSFRTKPSTDLNYVRRRPLKNILYTELLDISAIAISGTLHLIRF